MNTSLARRAALPLFARHQGLWLGIWAGSLVFALLAALLVWVGEAGSWRAVLGSATAINIGGLSAVLLGWTAAGLALRPALLRGGPVALVFVLGCWVCAAVMTVLQGSFAFLAFSLLLLTFVLLPFVWSVLGLLLFLALGLMNATAPYQPGRLSDLLAGGVVVLGIGSLMGALVLYIRRENAAGQQREALIEQLQAAQRDLALREREAGMMAERARLSRDLHDSLAGSLTAILAQLSAAELALDQGQERAYRHLLSGQDLARASLRDIRRLVWALRPRELGEAGILTALARLTREWQDTTGVASSFEVVGEARPLTPHAEVALLRLVQEALSNAARHARPSRVEVKLAFHEEFVMLDVTDDGAGFDVDHAQGGFGLSGMRERVGALGGRLLLESVPGEGSTVTAAFPLALVMGGRP